ncbi:MAG TPA: autotransporter-associated beta strand repeat-containing protein, partial [Luteolibacter sp.]|nr:autotransporter-associated beta strand repeat-containing protein [Luteolibacter sp.]
NYLITAGSYTTAATADFSTLTFDSTGGAINFALTSGHTLNSSNNGKAMLFSGSSDINLTGGHSTTTGVSALWFHNYLDASATLNLGVNWGNSVHMLVGGTGFTNYTGTGLGMSSGSDLVVDGGVFRVAADQNMAGYVGAARINDAVFEIGADLNGVTAGDFSGNIANFRLTGNAGLSAYTAVDGGVRDVGFTTDLTWGSNNFLTNASDNTDGDYALLLSSVRSNATINLTTNINLNGRHRTVDVANGSAAVDARLSGNLTGGLSSGLTKAGTGTLSLTGTNTYQGGTRVDAGKLIVGGGGINATTSLHVRNSSVEIAASGVINDAAAVTLENGIMIANGGGVSETMGALTIIGDNQLNLIGVGNAIRFADSSAQVWSSTLAILDWSGLSLGGGPDQVYFGTNASGITGSQLSKISFLNPTLDGQSYTGTFGAAILSTGEIVAVVPEPSLAALAFAGAGAALFRRRRRNG